MYRVCSVMFMGFQTWVDMVIFYMIDFDIIIGMTWLSIYYFVSYDSRDREKLKWEGVYKPK